MIVNLIFVKPFEDTCYLQEYLPIKCVTWSTISPSFHFLFIYFNVEYRSISSYANDSNTRSFHIFSYVMLQIRDCKVCVAYASPMILFACSSVTCFQYDKAVSGFRNCLSEIYVWCGLQEMSAPVMDVNGAVTGHIISTTIGGKNGEPKQVRMLSLWIHELLLLSLAPIEY